MNSNSKSIYFKSLNSLMDYFSDEKTCTQYYEMIRWQGNPVCPHCQAMNPYKTNRGYKCRRNTCYKKFNSKTGTIFENTKISMRLWFSAIYLCTIAKKSISSPQIARQLGITQKSAWYMMQRIRQIIDQLEEQKITTKYPKF